MVRFGKAKVCQLISELMWRVWSAERVVSVALGDLGRPALQPHTTPAASSNTVNLSSTGVSRKGRAEETRLTSCPRSVVRSSGTNLSPSLFLPKHYWSPSTELTSWTLVIYHVFSALLLRPELTRLFPTLAADPWRLLVRTLFRSFRC